MIKAYCIDYWGKDLSELKRYNLQVELMRAHKENKNIWQEVLN